MEDLFSTQPTNEHQSLIARDVPAWTSISDNMNGERKSAIWRPLEFDFKIVDNRYTKLPTICTLYSLGMVAFRASLKEALFPIVDDGLEFLPITAGTEPWLLFNCLKTVRQIDESNSQVMRALDGTIFMVLKLFVTDPTAKGLEMFTLEHSNHAQLFVRSSFKERVERLGLQGLAFHKIGGVASPKEQAPLK
jgi:hypothetical protein